MNVPGKYRRSESRHTFAILVALAAGSQTGSELQSRIIGDTAGQFVQASTIFSALHRLEGLGHVESQDKYYSLTDKGWAHLKNEAQALESLLAQAKHRIIGSGHGRW